MLGAIKRALGIRSDYFDEELTVLIEAGKSDLSLAGVNRFEDSDPLIITAIACYCQANRGTDAENRARFGELYAKQKRNLMYAGEYHDAE